MHSTATSIMFTRRTLLAVGTAAMFTGKPARADSNARYLSAAASFTGRFAVVADPQGATFMFLQPNAPDQPLVPATTPGHSSR